MFEERHLDELRENAASPSTRIGTTKRGIGPAYEDKVGRRAIRLVDLAHRGGKEARRVIDQRIQTPIMGNNSFNQTAQRAGIQQIGLHDQGRIGPGRVERSGEGIGLIPRLAAMEHDPRACGMQVTGDFSTDAPGCAGHEGDRRSCRLIHDCLEMGSTGSDIIRCRWPKWRCLATCGIPAPRHGSAAG
mgnify:CR=1 FL=1